MAADLDTLRRWEDAGGTWHVLHRRPGEVELSLRRCDGGEEVDRLVSRDRELVSFVDARDREDR